MAFDPGPPPKRKDYLTEGTWWLEKERWKRQKEAWRIEQRRLHKQQVGRIAGAVLTAAMTAHDLAGAVQSPGLVAGAFPGHAEDAESSMMNTARVMAHNERDRQAQDMDEGTRDKGYGSGYDSIY